MSQTTAGHSSRVGPQDLSITVPAAIRAEDKPYIFVNGSMLPKNQASVSVFDHGLLYGDGIFEGIRVYRGKIFKCGQHMDRLWRCAERIKLQIPYSREEMVEIQRRCIETNEIVDGYIRLIVTRGVGTLGLNPYACPRAGVICIADQIRLYPQEMYEQGMKVVVAERPRIPIDCLDPRIKSLNYLNNILAKMEALDQGLFEVIMLNTEGFVSEGSGDNIFIIKDGKVITPPDTAGILQGITRRFVIEELCPKLGIPCEERLFRIEELLEADEVFLTGSAAEIIAVTKVGERPSKGGAEFVISDGEGEITKRLRTAFREVVTNDPIPED
ncbi:MAG: branched-chain-amino-acid transaminase [Phycisphaerales bacterium JB037]